MLRAKLTLAASALALVATPAFAGDVCGPGACIHVERPSDRSGDASDRAAAAAARAEARAEARERERERAEEERQAREIHERSVRLNDLGIAAMNAKDYAAAIRYFRDSLDAEADDVVEQNLALARDELARAQKERSAARAYAALQAQQKALRDSAARQSAPIQRNAQLLVAKASSSPCNGPCVYAQGMFGERVLLNPALGGPAPAATTAKGALESLVSVAESSTFSAETARSIEEVKSHSNCGFDTFFCAEVDPAKVPKMAPESRGIESQIPPELLRDKGNFELQNLIKAARVLDDQILGYRHAIESLDRPPVAPGANPEIAKVERAQIQWQFERAQLDRQALGKAVEDNITSHYHIEWKPNAVK